MPTRSIPLLPHTQIPCHVFDSDRDLARVAAQVIAQVIRDRNALGQRAVLGLATGSTPVDTYRELIRLHRDEGLDFSQVVTFNLDEYFGLQPGQLQSYHRWIHENLFKWLNVPSENIHIPDGGVAEEQAAEYCREYENRIVAAGGIDVLVLGIGRNGHVGFNEPCSDPASRTRLCTLDPITRQDAAADFYAEENVPLQAITMGLGTILQARKILLIALGEHKANIVRQVLEEPVAARVPASYLQQHQDALALLDRAAASQLTAVSTPWLIGPVTWDDATTKRAVLWLCEQTGKALLKLEDEDFRENSLHQLLRRQGPAQKLCHRVFRWMLNTVEYHPAGTDPNRIICFSPHPDDDVISMGGTLIRLAEDGHEVHVAYMTSGNIAVFDHDARRIADLVSEYNRLFDIDRDKSESIERTVLQSLAGKNPGEPDRTEVQRIKSLIRWSEAKAAGLASGCLEEHLHFMDLPFYRTGTVAKHPVGQQDVQLVRELIQRIAPHQIFMAGDLSDPHGTHRLCAEIIFQALGAIRSSGGRLPQVLLYRGAWQEYALHEIDIAVPLSPSDLDRKRQAIFMHESQKDEALFPGSDPREFWQRADDRNRGTADKYNRIGLPEYLALEAFVRWNGLPL